MPTIKHLSHARMVRSMQGFSLVELMISLVIGLIIMVATLSAYVSSSGASKISDAQSRMNEDAQAALNLLSQQIRMAGANPVQAGRTRDAFPSNPVYVATYVGGSVSVKPTAFTLNPVSAVASNYAIRGCDGTFGSLTSATNIDALTCAGTSTLPDSLAVNYEADRYSTVATSTNAPTDCVGQTAPSVTATFTAGTATTANYAVADNRFYIANSSGGIISLLCKGNGNATPQPLVENIEDMQLMYGVVSATNTNTTATIAGYLTADSVVNDGTLNPALTEPRRWGKVLTVRVCVVVRSESAVLTDTASGAYVKCDGTTDSAQTDRRLRRAYSTTVVLRNRRF
jgi:type IV pilus assembly protein PilW